MTDITKAAKTAETQASEMPTEFGSSVLVSMCIDSTWSPPECTAVVSFSRTLYSESHCPRKGQAPKTLQEETTFSCTCPSVSLGISGVTV